VSPSFVTRDARALNPVSSERDRDSGVYVEPNVWMYHRL
jgi:hypothetical protein